MSATLFAAFLLLGQATGEAGSASALSSTSQSATTLQPAAIASQKPAASPRSAKELQADVLGAMKRSSPTAQGDPAEHVLELISLYEELGGDSQLALLERERLRAMVRNRLELIAEKLSKQKPKKEVAKKGDATSRDAAKVESLQKPDAEQEVLAQFGGPGRGGNAGAGGFGGGFGPGGNGQPQDNGLALVDLIQKTIAPTTWDVRGGPGSIYYYRPLQVLVIRQTSEVHHNVGGLMGGLRRAGP